MHKTAFIGHRYISGNNLQERLTATIITEIENGCLFFTMGTHGEFDSLALYACRNLRKTYKDLKIEVVITSLNKITKQDGLDCAPYSDVNTVMYEVEDAHYKQRITLSNKKMIDGCDTLICYVDTRRYHSGAKSALNYAKRKGLRIINLFNE